MAYIVADRIKETTTTQGTGAISLAGAVSGYRSFASQMSVGDTCAYAIVSATGLEWEVGIATYSAVNTLTRTTVQSSTNANALVNFSAGLKDVFLGPTAGSVPGFNPITNTITSGTWNGNTIDVAHGGTGLTSLGTANQVLSVNPAGTALEYHTITSNPGTVTSVGGTGTVNGLTLTGTVTSSGNLTLGGTLSNVSLTSQVTGTLPVANGGTGVTTATGSGSVVLSTAPTLVTPKTNSIAAVPVTGTSAGNTLALAASNASTTGAGGSVTITAGNGSGVGAGGNIILQPGAQGTSGGNGWVKFYDITSANTRMGAWNNSTQGYGFGWDSQNNGTLGTGFVSSQVNGAGYVGVKSQTTNHFMIETNNGTTALLTNSANTQSRLIFVNGSNAQTTSGSAGICSYTTGVITIRDGGTSIAGGSLSFPSTTTALAANSNDLVLSASAFQRLTSNAAYSITGIAPPTGGTHVDGRIIEVYNTNTSTSYNLTFSHNNTSSAIANRFYNATGADIIIGKNDYVRLIYDATDNGSGAAGWRVS